MNYFKLFDIPVALKIDRAILSAKYFALQKKYHPDFFTQSSEEEQQEALQMSSQINIALKVLQNEEETIKYVLLQKELMTADEKYTLSPDFLMEMLELNEAVMEENPEEIKEKIQRVENDLYAPIKEIVDKFTDDNTTNDALLLVKDYYYKKKYLQRILDRITD